MIVLVVRQPAFGYPRCISAGGPGAEQHHFHNRLEGVRAMGPEVVDQRHGWRTEGTEVGEQVALDHVQHLGIAIMVDLVSKCRTPLFPEDRKSTRLNTSH